MISLLKIHQFRSNKKEIIYNLMLKKMLLEYYTYNIPVNQKYQLSKGKMDLSKITMRKVAKSVIQNQISQKQFNLSL